MRLRDRTAKAKAEKAKLEKFSIHKGAIEFVKVLDGNRWVDADPLTLEPIKPKKKPAKKTTKKK